MQRLGYAVGIFVLLAAVALIGVIVWRVTADMNGQLAVALITFVGTVSVAVWNFQKTKDKEAEARLFPQRAAVYEEILNVLKDLSTPAETGRKKPEESETVSRLLDAKFKLIVWGSANSLRALDAISDPNTHDGDMFAKIAYLMGSMRRDLGHKVDLQDCLFMSLYLMKYEDKGIVLEKMISSDFYREKLLVDFSGKK